MIYLNMLLIQGWISGRDWWRNKAMSLLNPTWAGLFWKSHGWGPSRPAGIISRMGYTRNL